MTKKRMPLGPPPELVSDVDADKEAWRDAGNADVHGGCAFLFPPLDDEDALRRWYVGFSEAWASGHDNREGFERRLYEVCGGRGDLVATLLELDPGEGRAFDKPYRGRRVWKGSS